MKRNCVILIALCSLILTSWFFWRDLKWDTGLGDKYGALTALFTGLAFAGLLFTLYFQQKQINETEKEQTLRRFENTFFHLRDSLDKIVGSTHVVLPDGAKIGELAFTELEKQFRKNFIYNPAIDPNQVTINLIKNRYEVFYKSYNQQLGRYFRVLYQIIKLLDTANIDAEKRFFYLRLIRAQLSSDELILLFYNCFVGEGVKFKTYVEKYSMLKHMHKEMVSNASILKYYNDSAYCDT